MRRFLLAAVAVLALNSVARATEDPPSLLETMNGDWAIDNTFNCSVPSKAYQVTVSYSKRVEWKDALGNMDVERVVGDPYQNQSFATITQYSMHRNKSEPEGTEWYYLSINSDLVKIYRNGRFAHFIVRCAHG
jgi:hypothetical protein